MDYPYLFDRPDSPVDLMNLALPTRKYYKDAIRHFVYVVGETPHYSPSVCKIGHSKAVIQRVKMMQTSHPNVLQIYRTYGFCSKSRAMSIEKSIHSALSYQGKRRNREWFDLTPEEAVEFIGRFLENIFKRQA